MYEHAHCVSGSRSQKGWKSFVSGIETRDRKDWSVQCRSVVRAYTARPLLPA
jgi:hypothetical protein